MLQMWKKVGQWPSMSNIIDKPYILDEDVNSRNTLIMYKLGARVKQKEEGIFISRKLRKWDT